MKPVSLNVGSYVVQERVPIARARAFARLFKRFVYTYTFKRTPVNACACLMERMCVVCVCVRVHVRYYTISSDVWSARVSRGSPRPKTLLRSSSLLWIASTSGVVVAQLSRLENSDRVECVLYSLIIYTLYLCFPCVSVVLSPLRLRLRASCIYISIHSHTNLLTLIANGRVCNTHLLPHCICSVFFCVLCECLGVCCCVYCVGCGCNVLSHLQRMRAYINIFDDC